MALPNFRLYYWAANIRCLTFWTFFYDRTGRPGWVDMELNSVKDLSILALIRSSLPVPSHISFINPVVRQSLKIWAQFRKHFNLLSFSLSSPILYNPVFPPSLFDPVFQEWHRQGIRCFRDLFIDNYFASFEQLSTKFNLSKTHFFRYLQARHFIHSQVESFPAASETNIMDGVLELHPTCKGLLSKLYNKLVDIRKDPLDKIKTAWERDLNVTLSENQWQSILRLVNSTSFCARHCLLQFKVVHRAHICKSKLSRFYSEVDPLCDKCRLDEGTLYHMFWACPSIEKFWREVFQTLSQILNITLKPNPMIAIFGTTAEEANLTPFKRRTLSFASLLARRAVLLRWRDAAPPTHSQWLKDLVSCLDLEKIRYSIAGCNRKFKKIWGPFLDHIQKLPSF